MHSFFIKYPSYKTGIRFEVSAEKALITRVLHNEEKHPEDEVCDIDELHDKLRRRFSSPADAYLKGGCVGDVFFRSFLNDLRNVSQNMYRKYPQARQARRHRNKKLRA